MYSNDFTLIFLNSKNAFVFRIIAMSMVMFIIILITAKVNCRWKTATPSIHSSSVRSTSDGFTSSCAVVEEGVPVCQDPEEANENFFMLQVYSLHYL